MAHGGRNFSYNDEIMNNVEFLDELTSHPISQPLCARLGGCFHLTPAWSTMGVKENRNVVMFSPFAPWDKRSFTIAKFVHRELLSFVRMCPSSPGCMRDTSGNRQDCDHQEDRQLGPCSSYMVLGSGG